MPVPEQSGQSQEVNQDDSDLKQNRNFFRAVMVAIFAHGLARDLTSQEGCNGGSMTTGELMHNAELLADEYEQRGHLVDLMAGPI